MTAANNSKDLHNEHDEGCKIELRLAGYEALAWKVIGGHGYPTNWEEFCAEFDIDASHPDAVKVANDVLFHTQAVRDQVKKGDAEGAALEALGLEHQAAKLMSDVVSLP